jgi:DNA-binding GntR family transcriptional regulator
MGAVLQSPPWRRAVWDEHEAIAQAIAAGDAKRSSPPATAHFEQAAAHMQEHLGQALATEPPTCSQGDAR